MVSLMASGAPCILGVEGGHIELHGALCLVGMLRPRINPQVFHLLAPEGPARNHPLHGLLQHPLGMLAVEDLLRGPALDAAGIARVPVVDLVGALGAGAVSY